MAWECVAQAMNLAIATGMYEGTFPLQQTFYMLDFHTVQKFDIYTRFP